MTRKCKWLLFVLLFQLPMVFYEDNFSFTMREGFVDDSTYQRYQKFESDNTIVEYDSTTKSHIISKQYIKETQEQIIKKKDLVKLQKQQKQQQKQQPKKKKPKYKIKL